MTAAALAERAEQLAADVVAFRTRHARTRAERPCRSCGARPTRAYLCGPLCASCAPPEPTGYCLPKRCYCPGPSCERPA